MIEVLDVWRGFWTTAIVLAGTLLGFSFVAAALRAREFFGEDRRLRALLYQTVTAYSAVAMVGLLILMPMLSQRRLGLVIAGVGTLLVVASSWRVVSSPKERSGLLGILPASACGTNGNAGRSLRQRTRRIRGCRTLQRAVGLPSGSDRLPEPPPGYF